MTSFASMNDSYYEPPTDRAWDGFVDYCDAEDLNPYEEDFEGWVEDQIQGRIDAEADRRYDYERENPRDDW